MTLAEARAALDRGEFIPARRCTICDEWIGYERINGLLCWNANCGCSSASDPDPRDESDLERWFSD